MTAVLFLQAPPIDPAAYGGGSWGVIGALVFVIVILGLIIYSVFVRGAAANQKRDESLMVFLASQGNSHAAALADLGKKIEVGDEKVAAAIANNAAAIISSSRTNQALLVAWEAVARAREAKAGSGRLTSAELSQIMKEAHETVRRSIG